MPDDPKELISQLRLALDQARGVATRLRALGYTVNFRVLEGSDKKEIDTPDVKAFVTRTTTEEHAL